MKSLNDHRKGDLTGSPPDLIRNSPHCLPNNSYNVCSENLILDKLLIP